MIFRPPKVNFKNDVVGSFRKQKYVFYKQRFLFDDNFGKLRIGKKCENIKYMKTLIISEKWELKNKKCKLLRTA